MNFKRILDLSGVTSAPKITKWGKSEDAACLPGAGGSGKTCQIKGYLSRKLNEVRE